MRPVPESALSVPRPVLGPESALGPEPAAGDAASPVSRSEVASPVSSNEDELALAHRLVRVYSELVAEVHKAIVGQDDLIELMLIAIFCRGHALMVGVPGLAKTHLVMTVGRVLDLQFSRVQFTPDLLPADITGSDVLQEVVGSGRRQSEFAPGPLFANLVLADEINRTPPKTQAALLEAMQEHAVTVGRTTHPLPDPFFVLATQNPIEQEGTYPLPEAQLDRFMFMLHVRYPGREEEIEVLRRTTTAHEHTLRPVFRGADLALMHRVVRQVPVGQHIYEAVVDLVRSTRPGEAGASPEAAQWLDWGAGPRATQCLLLSAKARALLRGRFHVTMDDIRALAAPVLRHRLVLNFSAQSEGLTSDQIVSRLLDDLPD